MDEITASDLLHAMVRIAPGGVISIAMGLALDGYTDAFKGRVSSKEALTKRTEYQKGYFCCNQHPMTISERTAEILGLQSIMIMLCDDAS